jgi:tagaturonate reductase
VRVVPSIVDNVRRCGRLPRSLVFGFAGYLEYMRVATGGPADDQGASVRARWERVDDSPESVAALVRDVCADTSLWTCDLTTLPGFAPAVTTELLRIRDQGALGALETHLSEAAVWQ